MVADDTKASMSSANGAPLRTPLKANTNNNIPPRSARKAQGIVAEDDSNSPNFQDAESDAPTPDTRKMGNGTVDASFDSLDGRSDSLLPPRDSDSVEDITTSLLLQPNQPAPPQATVPVPETVIPQTRNFDRDTSVLEPPSMMETKESPPPISRFLGSPEESLPAGYPTDLHAACSKINISAGKLRAVLATSNCTNAAGTVDTNGRLPLHLLGMNELLIKYFINQAKDTPASSRINGIPATELDYFVLDLVKEYRRGCITTDHEGMVPFIKVLKDWVTLASRGNLPVEGDENIDTLNNLMVAEDGGNIRAPPLEGMEQVVSEAPASREVADEGTEGSRSIWSHLSNFTAPSAFKSVYSASITSEFGVTTRALYRQRNEDGEEDDSKIADRKARSNTLDSNVASATAPETGARPAGGVFVGLDDRSLGSFSSAPDEGGFDDVFPDNLSVPTVVEWSLKMLSAIVDYFESGADVFRALEEEDAVMDTWGANERLGTAGADANQDEDNNGSEWIAKTLIAAVSSVPSVMKTLLLLDDTDPAKQRLFNLTIVKRMVYCPYTVGNWLVYMLEAVDFNVAAQGVQYLEMISTDPSVSDFYGSPTKLQGSSNKGVPTEQERLRLYQKVTSLDYLLPAVLALEDTDMVDRVAKTHLVRYIQDRELLQRPTLLMAFFDLIFNLMLLVSFTMGTNYFLGGGEYGDRYMTTFYICLACIIYLVAWKLAQMSSMIKISRSAFLANNFRAGDVLIDWLSLGMALGGLIWMEIEIADEGQGDGEVVDSKYMRGYLAVTIGMLWLSVLRWFYIVNWEVTTFIDMLKQVIIDMRTFFFILTITVLSFAQMFLILLYKGEEQCTDGGFCDPKDVYLQVYSIVLGQFNLDDFTTTFSIVMFVIFTLLVLILLFYALIAVVVEAHSKFMTARFSTAQAEHGSRARLVYVAQLRAFRRMIDQRWSIMQYVAAVLFFASSGLIMVLCYREIRDHFHEVYGDTLLAVIFGVLGVFLLFGILCFVSHMTYFDLSESDNPVPRAWNKFAGCTVIRWFAQPLRYAMLAAMGVQDEDKSKTSEYSTPMTEKKNQRDIVEKWGGTAAHIHTDVQRMIESAQDQTKTLITEELTSMEGRMKVSSDRAKADLLAELRSAQQEMKKMVAELSSMLAHGDLSASYEQAPSLERAAEDGGYGRNLHEQAPHESSNLFKSPFDNELSDDGDGVYY